MLIKSTCYENWLKEIEIWQDLTDLSDGKQGPAIFLTLKGKACEAILNHYIKEIKARDKSRQRF